MQEITPYQVLEYSHIIKLLNIMYNDGQIEKDLKVIVSTSSPKWEFETAMIKQFSSYGSGPRLDKLVCFEDDPIKYQNKKNSCHVGENIFLYPMDYYAGTQFLNDQSDKNFNMIYLEFDSIPRKIHFDQITNIIRKLIGSSKCLLTLSFKTELKKGQTVDGIINEYNHENRNLDIIDKALEHLEDGLTTNEIFIKMFVSLLGRAILQTSNSLCYSNYSDENESRMTLMYSLGQTPNYIKGLQLFTEGIMYRNNIELPDKEFSARTLNNIIPQDEIESEDVMRSGPYGQKIHVGTLQWRNVFQRCPVDEYVFIRSFKKKSNDISLNKVVARRISKSRWFLDLNDRKYKAAKWAPLVSHVWTCKDFNRVRDVVEHNSRVHMNH